MVKTNKSIKQDYQRNLEKIKESRKNFQMPLKLVPDQAKEKLY